jgi:hypothetical protein
VNSILSSVSYLELQLIVDFQNQCLMWQAVGDIAEKKRVNRELGKSLYIYNYLLKYMFVERKEKLRWIQFVKKNHLNFHINSGDFTI